jgi:putative two-component system response regulator
MPIDLRREAGGPRSFDVREQLRKLCQLGIALTAERDLNRLLDRILFEARRFTGAEAGTLYVRERDQLRFCAVQNDAVPATAIPAGSPSGSGRIPVTRKSIAGYVAETGELVNIRDVSEISGSEEYAFNDSFDRRTGYRSQSMLVVPMKEPGGRVIGVIQLINAREGPHGEIGAFDRRYHELILSLASQAAVALENAQLAAELKQAYEETILRLARAAEYRDTDTGEHIRRMSLYSVEIARALGWSEQQASELALAAPMHDIGKIAVPDEILKKPGRLTPEERKEMERHTTYGGEILAGSEVPILLLSQSIALTHHEKWDGTGYPRQLRGEAIPLAGRICALADVFDALTSKRVYKEALSVEQSCEIVREGRGTHFDPDAVDAFFRVLDRILEIRTRYSA